MNSTVPKIENYAHCQGCVRDHSRQHLDVGLTATGIKVSCRMHGVVWHLTPDGLRDELAKPVPDRVPSREAGPA